MHPINVSDLQNAGHLNMHMCCAEDEDKLVRQLQLLTHKPLTYAANVSENDIADAGASNAQVQALKKKAKEENCEVVVVSAQVW